MIGNYIKLILLMVFLLTGCRFNELKPEGRYLLKKAGAEYILQINEKYTYTMEVVRQGKSTIFSGTWEREKDNDAVDISLHDIEWPYNEDPVSRPGYFCVKFEGFYNSKICLDAEGITCLEKVEN